MNKEELVTLLRNQELRKIVFDTNALFSLKRFFDVCDRVDELDKQFKFKLEILIPALVYFEKLYDLRQKLIEFKEISCKTNLEILEQGLCELLSDSRALKASSN